MHSRTDSLQSSADALRYPWENHPGHDQTVEVMPGVLWVRLKLPFRLNNVNIYLLADNDGWTAIDSGFGNEESIAAWTTLLEGPLRGSVPSGSRPRARDRAARVARHWDARSNRGPPRAS